MLTWLHETVTDAVVYTCWKPVLVRTAAYRVPQTPLRAALTVPHEPAYL